MKISIITATYNSAKTVRDTLSSIASQQYRSVEHIIIDGLSKDNTLNIVAEFEHVAKIISEKDNGIYDAMNKGLQLATGDIIGILNSDDIYAHPNVLRNVASVFSDSRVEAVYADLEYVAAQDINKVVRFWRSGPFDRNNFYWGWMPPHPTFFVHRKLYENFGFFNTNLLSAADYELMLRFLLKHRAKAAYLPEVIVKMRVGGMSNVSIKNRLRAHKEDKMAWRINDLNPYFFTLLFKPLRKVFQFVNKS